MTTNETFKQLVIATDAASKSISAFGNLLKQLSDAINSPFYFSDKESSDILYSVTNPVVKWLETTE